MTFELPKLPFDKNSLAPNISAETLEFHHGKHHAAYVNNLNKLVTGTKYENATLAEIVAMADGGIFNNAAQVWNHTFYWNSISPNGGGEPTGAMKKAIDDAFGSFSAFKEEFTKKATTLFGSGWCWLVRDENGKLAIEQTQNAGNPITKKQTPILTCDVWEHAYYVDYRNARPKYLESYWNMVNWEFAEKNL